MSQSARFICLRGVLALAIVLVATFVSVPSALARNVPGSAAIPLREISETSTAQLIGGVHRGLLKARGEIRGDGQSTKFLSMTVPPNAAGDLGASGGFVREGDTGAIVNFEYRRIDDDDELEFDLFTGSALLFYAPNPNLLVFGGVVGETGDGKTPYNDGTLESQGVGLAAGVDYRLDAELFLTATAAFLSLDYDFTRSNGAIHGSFDALRSMFDLSANHHARTETLVTDVALGLRYIHQENDSYTESGGAFIGSSSSDTLSAILGGRARILTDAYFDPFVEADLRYDFGDDFDLPAGVPEPDSERFHTRLGFGVTRESQSVIFEAGGGLHLTEEGYDGYDARLRAVIRF